MDLPLYVLDDPKPHRRDEDDGERGDTLTHALELIAETFQRSEAVVPGSSPQEIAPPRTDRSSLILRRFLLVTPEVGERRLDEWLARSAGLVRAGTGTWRTIGRLPEEPEDKAIATRRPAAPPLRRIEGRLRLWASPVSVPVVLEMQPWYCSRVVLDLRPKDLTKKMAWLRRETYFRTSQRCSTSSARTSSTGLQSASRACSRSATRSAADSSPTDRRTSDAGTSSGEPATEAWVMRPGCSISDSTAPSDSASVNSSVCAHDLERGRLAARAA